MKGLQVDDLVIEYHGVLDPVRALDGVSIAVGPGKVLALVGESGSGKSTLAMAVGRLLHRSSRVVSGAIAVDGDLVHRMSEARLRLLRSEKLGYIFQDPLGSLDPTMKIGRQVVNVLSDSGARRSAEAVLGDMRFADVGQVLRSYPHEVSGGMAQRVAIAMTLARNPSVLIADEPTAALDASIRFEILDLMVRSCRSRDIAFLLSTHDLSIVRRFADEAAVMYAGRIVEKGPVGKLLERPTHPYTRALLSASLGAEASGARLKPIPGRPPTIREHQTFCAFAERCGHARPDCATHRPTAVEVNGREACCLRAEELAFAEIAE